MAMLSLTKYEVRNCWWSRSAGEAEDGSNWILTRLSYKRMPTVDRPSGTGVQARIVHRLALINPRQVQRHYLRIFLSRACVENDHAFARRDAAIASQRLQAIE